MELIFRNRMPDLIYWMVGLSEIERGALKREEGNIEGKYREG